MPTGCCKAIIRYSLCCLSMFNSIKAAGRRPTADKNGGVRQKQTIAKHFFLVSNNKTSLESIKGNCSVKI